MKTVTHTIVLAFAFALLANSSYAEEPEPKKPARKPVKLPGMVIDFELRCVDLEATVCLDKGFLEMVACTKGSKEHESIVAVEARPMHIHTALLLLGANNGNPAMRKLVGEEEQRWVEIPPRGDPIGVSLVFKNSDGKTIERPVSDFIARSKEQADDTGVVEDRVKESKAGKDNQFPHTFLFAGSHLRDNGKGPRQYLADLSGDVISIVTFGDELLCLPSIQSHDNEALMWRVNPEHLPKVGTKVTLRLRPRQKPVDSSNAEPSGIKK